VRGSPPLALALALALGASPALAQPRLPPRPRPIPVRPVKPARPKSKPQPKAVAPSSDSSLRSRVGIAVPTRLLKSKDDKDRVRAFERLGEVATPAALELLGKSLDPGGASSSAERLTIVRALSAHTPSAVARQALARAVSASSAGQGDDPGEALVRSSAALALARSGRRDGLEVLGKALRQEGPVASAAANALIAHPPRDIRPILGARGAATPTFVAVLEALGDQRAFDALRWLVRHGSPEIKARSAVALTRLGDFETVALAKQWLAAKHEPALGEAAARILALGHDAGAAKAIAALLDDPGTRETGLELALASPSPQLLTALERRLDHADLGSVPRYLGAIGRIGGDRAAKRLEAELGRADHAASAAYALALSPGGAALEALERALSSDATRRLAARAAVMRDVALGERASGLERALDQLSGSKDPADRAAGAWCRAALDPKRAKELIGRHDRVVVIAAARAAFTGPAATAAAERLAREPDGELVSALAIGLASSEAARHVPSRVLAELIEQGGAAAPLAARALAERDDETLRPQLELLFASGDPLVRSHIALGLARSDDPSAVGLLVQGYRFEQDADVRYAIVVALSERSERVRRRTLRLAAELDADGRVRQAARAALRGARLALLPRGSGAFWLDLRESDGRKSRARAALVQTPTGIGLPVLSDPDGLVTLAGLPRGPLTLRLAAAPDERNPSSAE
jgi:HEAT repeats